MPVCSYLVIPEDDTLDGLARKLSALPGCDVTRAANREILLLVTDTAGPEEDRILRRRLEDLEGIRALVLAFGEIDPNTDESDPLNTGRRKRGRRLPMTDPGALTITGFPNDHPLDPEDP